MLISEVICHCCQNINTSKSKSVDISSPWRLLVLCPQCNSFPRSLQAQFTQAISTHVLSYCLSNSEMSTGLLCSCPGTFKMCYMQPVGESKEMPDMCHAPAVLLAVAGSKTSILLPEIPVSCCRRGSSSSKTGKMWQVMKEQHNVSNS